MATYAAERAALVAELGPAFAAADLSIVNLETVVGTLTDEQAYPAKRWLLQAHPDSLAALDERAFEPPLPQCTGSFIGAINILHKALTKMLHHPGRPACLLGSQQDVDVIGHQAVGVNGTSVLSRIPA